MPLTAGVVDGAESVSIPTEFVVGICEAVGVELYWLPSTLCGGMGLPFGTGFAGAVAVTGCVVGAATGGGGAGVSAMLSSGTALGLGGEAAPPRGVSVRTGGLVASPAIRSMLVPVPSSRVARMEAVLAGP